MSDRPPLELVIDRLVERHGLSPSEALKVLTRAATRKDTTVDALASQIVLGPAVECLDDLQTEIVQLRMALESRDIIGQAKGILMERHGIGADQAFARLVAMSQASNVKLREVCEYLVELRTDDARPRPQIDFHAK